jgi:hypothetical protein
MAFFPWPNAREKAEFAARWIRERFKRLALPIDDLRLDFVGANMLHGSAAPDVDYDHNELGLRLAARASTREAAEIIRREVTHLWTMGPVGTAVGAPPRVKPVVALWPTLVPWRVVKPQCRIIEVSP